MEVEERRAVGDRVDYVTASKDGNTQNRPQPCFLVGGMVWGLV